MKILKSADEVYLQNVESVKEKLSELGDRVWMVKYNPNKDIYFLKEKEKFKIPSKIYGQTTITDRWLKSIKDNPDDNLGILLSGIKGCGKTQLVKFFCKKSKFPTLIVTEPYSDQQFIDFITDPALGRFNLLIDEFEKTYVKDSDISKFLTIMEGSFRTKINFLLTINNPTISEFMMNRLGRIKYRIHYESLDEEVMNDVIQDMLIDKSKENVKSVFDLFDKVGFCTFDTLIGVLKEMNSHKESALQAAKHLNLVPETKRYSVFEVRNGKKFFIEDAKIDLDDKEYEYWRPVSMKAKNGHIQINFKDNCDVIKTLKKITVYDRVQKINLELEPVKYTSLVF